jgi:nucleotide-binding universal stress UspA family protein
MASNTRFLTVPPTRVGSNALSLLARWGTTAQAVTIARADKTVGAALLDFARHANADLLVMGGDIFQARLEMPVLLSH